MNFGTPSPRRRPSLRQRGNVLLMVLVVTAILAFVIVAYVRMISGQNSFTTRSQVWHNCMPLVEAGIEEAMAQLNSASNVNFEVNGWIGNSTNFSKTNAMGEGYYAVSVLCTNVLAPVITCTGYLPAPATVAAAPAGALMAAAFTPSSNIRYISRTVRVTTKRDPMFPKGLVARSSIDFNGNKIMVDSYDSTVAPYNAATARDKGDVTMNGDIANLGNGDIKGKLIVGPKSTIKTRPNGTVGSVGWHAAGKSGIEPGWLRRDANVALPDVKPPWTGGAFTPTAQGSFKYHLDGGNFELNTLNIADDEKMFIKETSTLYVKNSVNIAGLVTFGPGAKLRLFVGGPNCTLLGTYEKSDVPADFLIYGLPGLKSISVDGFAAAIYAPNAALTLDGGSDFYGASIIDSARFNGNCGYHYDESLAILQNRTYTVTSWHEL